MMLARYHKTLLSPSEGRIYEAAEKVVTERLHSIKVRGSYSKDETDKALRALEYDDPYVTPFLYGTFFSTIYSDDDIVLYPHYKMSLKDETERKRRIEDAAEIIAS